MDAAAFLRWKWGAADPRRENETSAEVRAAIVAGWPEDVRDDFEERAAIREFCGGQSREAAEAAALAETELALEGGPRRPERRAADGR